MKYSILAPLFLCLMVCCSKGFKEAEDDGAANGHIRGRLFLLDTITTNKIWVPLAGKTLTIYYQGSTDEENYLFATQTDKEGYFIFEHLNIKSNYKVKYEEKSDSDRIYTGIRENIKPNYDTLYVNAWLNFSKENGLHYTVIDTDGNAVKGATVCIFNNKEFFQAGKCENSRYSLVTDEKGHAFKFNIPNGTYYTTAFITSNGATYSFKHEQNVVTNKKELIRKPLEKNKLTEFTVNVVDKNGKPVANANVCVFSSEIIAGTKKCELANFSKLSDASGKVKITGLAPGTYFVYAKIESGTPRLSGTGTIQIINEEARSQDIIVE